ncbi:MAG TPA: acyltransferase [Solirubrobacteraceae bacterium]|nr:acyltransferase [Solirubrobacteraceae bacterium]
MQKAPPDVVAPPPGNPRFPLFDSLRAIAALAIVVTHTAGLSTFNSSNDVLGPFTARADVGVTVFFVISGFLLYRPFVSARYEGRAAPRAIAYARRRLLRIVPAYWLALTVLAVWPGLTGVFGGHFWVYYLYVQNWRPQWIVTGLGPAWSLDVEMGFYLVLPLFAWLLARTLAGRPLRTQVRVELVVLAALGLASLAARTYQHAHQPNWTLPNTLPGTLLWFALGMGLAVASAALHGRPERELPRAVRLVVRRPSLAWLAAFGFLLWSTRIGLPRAFPYRYGAWGWFGQHLLYGAFSFCLVLPAVFGDRAGGLPRRVLAWRPLAWLGLVSYGIYLWHLPLAVKMNEWLDGSYVLILLATTAAAVACATASYYLVERPLLRFKEGLPRRRAAALSATAPAPAGRAG